MRCRYDSDVPASGAPVPPNYLDGTPSAATSQKWTSKAIFRVGQWSDEVSIVIGG
jgi:hypothetical protein